jgi:hypothetical protein
MVDNSNFVYSVSDSTELLIQRTIKGIQKMIRPYGSKGEAEQITKAAVIEINPAMKRHWKSEIKILRDAPREPDKLELLKSKQRQYEEAKNIKYIQ